LARSLSTTSRRRSRCSWLERCATRRTRRASGCTTTPTRSSSSRRPCPGSSRCYRRCVAALFVLVSAPRTYVRRTDLGIRVVALADQKPLRARRRRSARAARPASRRPVRQRRLRQRRLGVQRPPTIMHAIIVAVKEQDGTVGRLASCLRFSLSPLLLVVVPPPASSFRSALNTSASSSTRTRLLCLCVSVSVSARAVRRARARGGRREEVRPAQEGRQPPLRRRGRARMREVASATRLSSGERRAGQDEAGGEGSGSGGPASALPPAALRALASSHDSLCRPACNAHV